MKKALLNFRALGLVALVATGVAFTGCNADTKGCMIAADDNYSASATEDDGSCNEEQTTSKYERNNVTMNINGDGGANGTYLLTIAEAAADYTITVTTNWGLTGGIDPVNFTGTVIQNQATFPTTSIAGGSAAGTVTYNDGTDKITIAVTLTGFGAGIDGTTNDTEN